MQLKDHSDYDSVLRIGKGTRITLSGEKSELIAYYGVPSCGKLKGALISSHHVVRFARFPVNGQLHGVRARAYEAGRVGADEAEVGAVAIVVLAAPLWIGQAVQFWLS